MDVKWVSNLIDRGEKWDLFLLELLSNQTAEFKADYYEKIYLLSNKENADFLMRLAFRLSDFFLKSLLKKQTRATTRTPYVTLRKLHSTLTSALN